MNVENLISKIARSTTEIINIESLKEKLLSSQKNKKPLSVKAGFDPTAPDIHLGHVVLLRKLRQFQDLGHKVFFLIGDFTALVGDPTGQVQIRPVLTSKEIKENAKTYKKQIFKILDPDPKKLEVVFNSSWLGKFSAQEAFQLTKHSTVAQMSLTPSKSVILTTFFPKSVLIALTFFILKFLPHRLKSERS